MKINQEISKYLNGEYFNYKYCKDISYEEFVKKVENITAISKFKSFDNLYKNTYKNIKYKKNKTIQSVPKLNLNKEQQKGFLKPLNQFQEYVQKSFSKEDIIGVYIHGSLADMEYVPYYSDFDGLIIVKESVLNSKKKTESLKKKIIKANAFLYLLDPLQHHRLFIINECDMNYYFEPIFPLLLFEYSKEVTDFQNKLEFSCLDDKPYKDYFLTQRIHYFKLWQKEKNLKTYDLKNIVQSILLLPSLFFEQKENKYIYKKYSFEEAKKYFEMQEWLIVDQCTKVRNKCFFQSYWPYFLRKFIGLNIHYKYLHILHKFFDRSLEKKIQLLLGEDYLQRALDLAYKMEAICKREI